MSNNHLNEKIGDYLYQYLIRLADTSLTMGQRLAEWCGHGPYLEEDVALTNVSLDTIGHANLFYQLAAELNDEGKTVDDLAYLRDVHEYRNPILTELPRGDFGYTMMKQYFIDVYHLLLYKELAQSTYQPLADVAKKALIEVQYHHERSHEWLQRLSLSTDEAKAKMQMALDQLWFYTPELFETNEAIDELIEQNVAADLAEVKIIWQMMVESHLSQCELKLPESGWIATGGLDGEHSEHLGYMLAEMQFLQRAYPGCEW